MRIALAESGGTWVTEDGGSASTPELAMGFEDADELYQFLDDITKSDRAELKVVPHPLGSGTIPMERPRDSPSDQSLSDAAFLRQLADRAARLRDLAGRIEQYDALVSILKHLAPPADGQEVASYATKIGRESRASGDE